MSWACRCRDLFKTDWRSCSSDRPTVRAYQLVPQVLTVQADVLSWDSEFVFLPSWGFFLWMEYSFLFWELVALGGVGFGKNLADGENGSWLKQVPYVSIRFSLKRDGTAEPKSRDQTLSANGKRKSLKFYFPFGWRTSKIGHHILLLSNEHERMPWQTSASTL